jgi:hypothetical protein
LSAVVDAIALMAKSPLGAEVPITQSPEPTTASEIQSDGLEKSFDQITGQVQKLGIRVNI